MKIKLPLNRKMQVASVSAILTLLVLGAVSYRSIVVSEERERWVLHSHEVLENLQDLLLAIESIESNYRGFVVTGQDSFLEFYRASVLNVEQRQASVRNLTVDNPRQQRRLLALETLAAQKIHFAETVIGLRRAKGLQSAAQVIGRGTGERIMNQFRGVVREMQDEELRLLMLRNADAKRRVAWANSAVIFGIVLGLLITAAATWSVQRENSKRGLSEQALRESEGIYRMLLEDVQHYAIFMLDPQGIVISWNSGAERIKGYKADEIIGHNFSCFFSPEDIKRGRPEEVLRMTATSGREEEQGMRVRKDGSRFLASVTFTALRDPAGNLRGYSEVSHDLSESKEAGAKYRGLLEAAPDAMVVVNQGGEIVLLNVQAEKQFGYRRDELIGQKVKNIIPEGFAERLIADGTRTAAEALAQQIGTGIELYGRRKNGSDFPIEIMLSPLESAEGILVTAAIRDISMRKAAERHLEQMEGRYRGLLEAAPDAMVVVNQGGEIVLLNIQAEKQFGYRRDELVGQKMKTIIPEGFAERLVADGTRSAEEALAQQIGTGIELTGRRKDGSSFPIEIMLSPLKSAEGILVTAAIRNVSVARAMSLQITHLAEHDFLTGLPNRTLVNDRIIQAIAGSQRHGKKVAVLFLDLDGFKHINDSLGHPIGDKLLQSIANRLVTCVRGSDTISRQGGDEFVMLLLDVNRPEDAGITARRMLKVVAEPHSIDQHDLHITASMGVSIYPDDGLDADTLIKNADTAMYQAKENGRQSYQFFKSAMNVRAVERQSIEESLRRALERQEFTLRYQPKVNLRTGQITGAEALLRWTHPVRGQVPPGQFIGVAEACGLILPIGNWVLREACKQAQAWADAGLRLGSMAVNISALEFGDEKFLEKVFAILEETRLEPRFLELELTESVLMKRAESTEFILRTLREREVQLAVDDFGTGYSSLSYLTKFPIDALKIDQSFIRQITTTPDDTAIVTAVISMGRSLNLRVVAEGVETEEELAFLQSHHCDEAQGYLLGRPLPSEEFSRLLETGISESVLAPSTILGSALV
jgi:diguanylate cyclase (GGDEF)-like protein/PAS domain S-box-containing protein